MRTRLGGTVSVSAPVEAKSADEIAQGIDRGVVCGSVAAGCRAGAGPMLVVYRRHRRDPKPTAERASKSSVARAFFVALPALVLPFLIRAAVVEGVATATEVSTIGIAYAALVGLLIYRCFDWAALRPMLVSTACLTGAILLIIGTATGMAWGLTQSGFSRTLAGAMTGLPGGAATFMAASVAAFVVLGSVLEGIPAIVLFGPPAVSVRRSRRHSRCPLSDGGHPGDGDWSVRTALWRRLLRRLRHRPCRPDRGHAHDPGATCWRWPSGRLSLRRSRGSRSGFSRTCRVVTERL